VLKVAWIRFELSYQCTPTWWLTLTALGRTGVQYEDVKVDKKVSSKRWPFLGHQEEFENLEPSN